MTCNPSAARRLENLLSGLLLFGLVAVRGFAAELTASPETKPDAMWTYKVVAGKELHLSVFLPSGYQGSSKRYPTILLFHGGSWRTGEPSMHYPDCLYWRKRGMVAISVDYRLKDRDGIDVPLECVKDAKSAMRFLRANADRLKIDVEKIVAAGASAGGQLAAALATISSAETNDDCYDPAIPCRPAAVVLYNPYFKGVPELSPPEHLVAGLPPFITFLGDKDPAVSIESLLGFHRALKQSGVTSEYYVGKGGAHGFCNGRNHTNRFFYWSLELADRFLVQQGILSGSCLVEIPKGVAHLQKTTDFVEYD